VENEPELAPLDEDILDYDEVAAPKKGGMTKARRMRLTHNGLNFHFAKMVCLLLAIACLIGMIFFQGMGNQSRSGWMATATTSLAMTYLALLALAPIMGVSGSFHCLWVPRKTGGKALILNSFILDGLALLSFAGALAVSIALATLFADPKPPAGPSAPRSSMAGPFAFMGLLLIVGMVASAVMAFSAWVTFMLFLRRLAGYFRDHRAADTSVKLVVGVIALVIGTPIYFVVGIMLCVYVGRKVDPAVAEIALWTLLVTWIVMVSLLLVKILAVINIVRGHLRRWA
jgi:hypothetical protein